MSTTEDYSELVRVPPHSAEIEKAVIGALLLEPQELPRVMPMLDVAAFYTPMAAASYGAMTALLSEGAQVDMVSVCERAVRCGSAREDTLGEWLIGAMDSVPSAANVIYHSRVVAHDWGRRQVISACDTLRVSAGQRDKTLRDDVMGHVDTVLRAVADRGRQSTESVSMVLERVFVDVDRRISGDGGVTIPFTYEEIERFTGRIELGYNIVIGAQSSVGKTTLCANMALRLAHLGYKTAFFSLEMDNDQLVRKIAAIEGRVNGLRLRNGQVDDDELRRFIDAGDRVGALPIYLAHCPGMTCLEVAASIERHVHRHGIQVAFVDYIQLIAATSSTQNSQARVEEAARVFQANAQRLLVPHIITSQLNRGASQMGHEPRMSELRDSGAIEQAADVVLLLYRDMEAERASHAGEDYDLGVVIGKAREGAVGKTELHFESQMQVIRGRHE